MTRSELRKNIFKLVFRTEFHSMEEMEEQLSFRLTELSQEGVREEDLAYIEQKAKAILSSLE